MEGAIREKKSFVRRSRSSVRKTGMKTQTSLSVIIIAKNEEKRIEKALRSVAFAGEVIVVDNGSTDDTSLIAKKLGARIISFESDDFSAIRMQGMKDAKYDWILYLDADETVTEELRAEILSVLGLRSSKNNQNNVNQNLRSTTYDLRPTVSAYSIPRRNFYLGREWPTQDKQVRLFRKKYLRGWTGKVHESALVDGEIGDLTHCFDHDTHRTLSEMVAKTNEWSAIEAQLRFVAHHPKMSWWRMFRVMLTSFWDFYITQKGYLVGMVGIIESMYQSFSTFITYAKLWELQGQRP
jgi:glycosyltransferase involved in cell wall biosynthesis